MRHALRCYYLFSCHDYFGPSVARNAVVGHWAESVRPTQNFVAQGFGDSSARLCLLNFSLLTLPSSAYLAVTMANQQDAAKTDPLTGMAHSEAHYFNRYAVPVPVPTAMAMAA